MKESIALNLYAITYSWLHIYPNTPNIIPQKSHGKLSENVLSIVTTLENIIYAHSFYPPLARERGRDFDNFAEGGEGVLKIFLDRGR